MGSERKLKRGISTQRLRVEYNSVCSYAFLIPRSPLRAYASEVICTHRISPRIVLFPRTLGSYRTPSLRHCCVTMLLIMRDKSGKREKYGKAKGRVYACTERVIIARDAIFMETTCAARAIPHRKIMEWYMLLGNTNYVFTDSFKAITLVGAGHLASPLNFNDILAIRAWRFETRSYARSCGDFKRNAFTWTIVNTFTKSIQVFKP